MNLLLTTLLTLHLFAFQKPVPSAEQTLFQLLNQHRAEANLPPLTIDPALAQAALAHATRMAQEKGDAQHQYPGEPDLLARAAHAGARFSVLSENVASGMVRPSDIDRSWMKSPSHRANILDPRVNVVGISVLDRNGTLYLVEDFAQATPSLSREQVEARGRQALTAQGIQPAPSGSTLQDARTACESQSSTAPNAILIMQWDGPDLAALPQSLLQQMPQARDHTATVGACPSKRTAEGFTTYRVAVLLY